ncbi:MAG TPA: PEP-CTERM sorting domain-containing protein [Opitutus sp.]|nr:PEP-CTERM sorting domain-containing protein [Opitutus sp.]
MAAATLLLASEAFTQTTIEGIGLSNPYGISMHGFLDDDGTADFNRNMTVDIPDPVNAPDDWSATASVPDFFPKHSSLLFQVTNTAGDGAAFRLQIENSGANVAATESSFLIVVSGLDPANVGYTLSNVDFKVSPYGSETFDLNAFPALEAGSIGAFTLTNSFLNGVLTIAVATSFNFLAGGNFVISGTFDAIDTSAVPEPAVAALALALGAAGFVAWRRRPGRIT